MSRFFFFSLLSILPFIGHGQESTNPEHIKEQMRVLTKDFGYRDYLSVSNLNASAEYIYNEFILYADSTYYQEYEAEGNIYKNVVAVFNGASDRTIIIGAHYDACGEQEAADDNASGVVGVLELARRIANEDLLYRTELVAYTLEEPPFFRTDKMGSYIHASSLKEKNVDVYGMLSVEMIGYFSDEKGSQKYPLSLFSWWYGDVGDFIGLIGKWGGGTFASRFSSAFKKANTIKSISFSGPTLIQGIDFSDHLNYWKFGYSALMITDTAFMRNLNYHQKSDTMETLDYVRMAQVIDGIYEAFMTIQSGNKKTSQK